MNNNSKKILSYVLVLASLFIIVLFTKDLLFAVQENTDLKNSKETENQEKRSEYQKLSTIKQELQDSGNTEVEKYAQLPTEDKILDYFYSLIENGNLGKTTYGVKNPLSYGTAEIKGITIGETTQNELWFSQTDITLNLSVNKETRLKAILDSLVSDTSEYQIFIDTFAYNKPQVNLNANNTSAAAIEVSLPLKIFSK